MFHDVKPDKVEEYNELVGDWYPRMAAMPENKVHLVGSWRTEVGDCNTFGEIILHHMINDILSLRRLQSTFGSINAMRATTSPYTTFNRTQTLLPSMLSSRALFDRSTHLSCKNSLSGPRLLLANLAVFSNSAPIHYTRVICLNGRRTGGVA